MASLPLYTTVNSVKVRLAGKVQFQSAPDVVEPGELPDELLLQLIADAETEVEQGLCGRFFIPFQSIRTGRYADLPDHSQRALRMAVDLKAVMLILMTDFGRAGHVDAKEYFESQEDLYDKHLALLLGHGAEQADEKQQVTRWRRTPPLSDLRLAVGNTEADDGYRGTVINTDQSEMGVEDYAKQQINNPSAAFAAVRKGGVIR
jgi:hypothetical protein